MDKKQQKKMIKYMDNITFLYEARQRLINITTGEVKTFENTTNTINSFEAAIDEILADLNETLREIT